MGVYVLECVSAVWFPIKLRQHLESTFWNWKVGKKRWNLKTFNMWKLKDVNLQNVYAVSVFPTHCWSLALHLVLWYMSRQCTRLYYPSIFENNIAVNSIHCNFFFRKEFQQASISLTEFLDNSLIQVQLVIRCTCTKVAENVALLQAHLMG